MIFLKLTFNLTFGPPLRLSPQTSKTSGCKLAGSYRPLDMIPAERQLQKIPVSAHQGASQDVHIITCSLISCHLLSFSIKLVKALCKAA